MRTLNEKISSGLRYAWKRRHRQERDIRLWVWIFIGFIIGWFIGAIIAFHQLKPEKISTIQFTGRASILKTEPRKKVIIATYEPVVPSISIKSPIVPIKEYAKQLVGDEFWALDYIVEHEGGWYPTKRNPNRGPTAQNPHSTAYGIMQFLNGTWKGTGYTKTSDPYKQIDAGIVYMTKRYGSITQAYKFKLKNNWY